MVQPLGLRVWGSAGSASREPHAHLTPSPSGGNCEQETHHNLGDSFLGECSTQVLSLLIGMTFKHQISIHKSHKSHPKGPKPLFSWRTPEAFETIRHPQGYHVWFSRHRDHPRFQMMRSGFSKVSSQRLSIYQIASRAPRRDFGRRAISCHEYPEMETTAFLT